MGLKKVEIHFIHGKPASGKDVQSTLLSNTISSSQVVSGVYRKAYLAEDPYSQYNTQVSKFILPLGEGMNIPGVVVKDIFENIIKFGINSDFYVFFVCGFLRQLDHYLEINSFILEQGFNSTHTYLAVPDRYAISRAEERKRSSGLSRPDDSPYFVSRRLERYKEKTLPMLKIINRDKGLSIIKATSSIPTVNQKLRRVFT